MSGWLGVAVNDKRSVYASTHPTVGTATWTRTTIAGSHGLEGVSCPTATFCVAADTSSGLIAYSDDPAGGASAWTNVPSTSDGPSDLQSISCASPSQCVAAGSPPGAVIVSQDPSGGANTWKPYVIDGDAIIEAVSCAPGGPCAAVDVEGNVFVSADPVVGAETWTQASVDPSGLDAIACQSASLCVAGDLRGAVAVSTAPAGSSPGWSVGPQMVTSATQPTALSGIACPSASLCVAVDANGDVLTTTHPTRTSARWKLTTISDAPAFAAVSCPSARFCAAVGPFGSESAASPIAYVATTTHPAGGPSAWKLTGLRIPYDDPQGGTGTQGFTAIGCQSSRLCVAGMDPEFVDQFNIYSLAVSHAPLAGAKTWHRESPLDPDGNNGGPSFSAISCPSAVFCAAAGGEAPSIAVSTDGAKRWERAYDDTTAVEDVTCPSRSFCAAVDDAGNVITSRNPEAGAKAWHRVRIDGRHALTLVSCASSSFCVALNHKGRAFVSDQPAGGAQEWRPATIGKGATGISCPTPALCLITTHSGSVIVGALRR